MVALATYTKPCWGSFVGILGFFLYTGYPQKQGMDTRAKSYMKVTESQNHRMVGVGRDFCGSSSPTLLPKQGHLQQAAEDLVQAGLEYLQRRRLHNLPGQPVPVLCHPQSEEVLPHVQLELPMLQFVPIVPCPVSGHHRKESGPILLTPTLRIFINMLEKVK